jgi:MFS family permease
MFTGALTGPLFDAGYFRALITVGTFMVPLGLFMTSISSKFWHFILAQGFCVGLGAGTLFVPAIAILPQYFIEKRGLAIGIVSAGSSVGAVLYPIIFERLQENIGFLPSRNRNILYFALPYSWAIYHFTTFFLRSVICH